MTKISVQPPSGFRDFLPEESALRAHAIAVIAESYRLHGFQQIFTAAAENLAVLQGKGGGSENEKLIFRLMRRGLELERGLARISAQSTTQPNDLTRASEELSDLGLRFDLTVPLARYVCRFRAQLPQPLRIFQLGAVWRADRPQKGRFREFWQCDVDILGTTGIGAETEVLSAIAWAFKELKVTGLRFRLNDRRLLASAGKSFGFAPDAWSAVLIALDKLDKIGEASVREEIVTKLPNTPASALDNLFEQFKRRDLADWRTIDGAASTSVATILESLSAQDVPAEFSPTLIRGQDYYTGAIFEVTHPELDGSLAGGGRYDRLLELFGGQPMPAFGGSIGFERLMLLLAQSSHKPEVPYVLLAIMDETSRTRMETFAKLLRENGLRSEVFPDGSRKLGQQLKYAVDRGMSHAVIVGSDELERGVVVVKNLKLGSQVECEPKALLATLQTSSSDLAK